ncbi:MAG: hypothetical protein EOO20_01605 [Chryseobacterium sp.]|nr:MAG: hypothetical protein EOO20_01605 [Chryseobacterium sp.]
MTRDLVVQKIFKGIKEAHFLSIELLDGDFTQLRPEYALTVTVAQAFVDDFKKRDYLIKIEEPTKTFASSCVPQHTIKKLKFAGDHNSGRNGKIDIALYKNKPTETSWFRPPALCPIELKGVNPSVSEFHKDIARNIEYFLLTDQLTGKSELEMAFFGTAFYYPKMEYNSQIPIYKTKVKSKVEKWMKKFEAILTSNELTYTIEIEILASSLVDESDSCIDSDIIADCHCFIGVVLVIERFSSLVY